MSLARWVGIAGTLIACGSRSDLGRGASSSSSSEESTIAPSGANAVPVWPRRCVSDWQTLFEEESQGGLQSGLTQLAYARGEVVFSFLDRRLARGEIRAVDATSGGRGRLITVALPNALWLDDAGQLLYWERQQLFDVAFAGGTPELVLDARGGGSASGTALVTPTELFWTQTSADGQLTEFWRRARESGRTTELASFERDAFTPSVLALGSDVLVASDTARAIALPLDGESPRELSQVSSGMFMGIGGHGAYYTRVANRSARGGDANEHEILRAPVDGGPPIRAWRGGAGRLLDDIVELGDGWLATGYYYFGDGPPRAVVVYIEASGREHVLACHPGRARIVSRPILEGSTLYVATETERLLAIAKISLSD